MDERELLEHDRRIAELERKVSELYERLGSAEPSGYGFGSGFSEPSQSSPDEDPRVLELVQSGKKIQAIKIYRELTGTGLKEAKEAVERLEEIHRPTA